MSQAPELKSEQEHPAITALKQRVHDLEKRSAYYKSVISAPSSAREQELIAQIETLKESLEVLRRHRKEAVEMLAETQQRIANTQTVIQLALKDERVRTAAWAKLLMDRNVR